MIETTNILAGKIIRDLTGTRHDLFKKLQAALRAGQAEILANYTCTLRNTDGMIQKSLFRVTDPKLIVAVRIKAEQLIGLRQMLIDQGEDLSYEHGLWVPAVADPENGDTQINLSIYQNGVTKTMDATMAMDMLDENNPALRARLQQLCSQYEALVLRRHSGKAYKVAIRGSKRDGGREMCGLNDFAVVLGDNIQVILPAEDRPRATRNDVVHGAPALLKFRGQRNHEWTVYAPPEMETA